MLLVLSPAKSLDFDTPVTTEKFTIPDFIEPAAQLVNILKGYAPDRIASLMKISDPLAVLNASRYASWTPQFTVESARQAVLTFNGDVYAGLEASTFNAAQLDYLQDHLRILSGLYGVLRPLDLMQAYRLEMGTRLPNARGKDLYAFWGNTITQALNEVLERQTTKVLVNLASEEYFKSVKVDALHAPVITPVFEDWNNGKYKILSFFAKRARGLMTRYAAENNIDGPEALKGFDVDGYAFEPAVSTSSSWVFRRCKG